MSSETRRLWLARDRERGDGSWKEILPDERGLAELAIAFPDRLDAIELLQLRIARTPTVTLREAMERPPDPDERPYWKG